MLAVRGHIADAITALRGRDRIRALGARYLDDAAIHAARKSLKRARSALRLVRPAVSEAVFRRENAHLRMAARRLSSVRDGRVLLDEVAKLLERETGGGRELLERLQAELERSYRSDSRSAYAAAGRIGRALGQGARRLERLAPSASEDGDVAGELRRLYRKGRKALQRARAKPTDERLHEARKQVKHLAHALELVAGTAGSEPARTVLKQAEALGVLLGDDHDLAILEAHMERVPFASAESASRLRSGLERRRAKLQQQALERGKTLYRRETKAVLLSGSQAGR